MSIDLSLTAFLDKNVFYDLENLNDGFDALSIKYFSKRDFEKVMDRCEKYNILLLGIEPWPNGEFGGVKVRSEYLFLDMKEWHRVAFSEFLAEGIDSYFAASYSWETSDI